MNILFDTYIYRLQKAGGINRYLSEIVSRLPSSFKPHVFTKIENDILVPQNKKLKFLWLPTQLMRSSWLLKKRLQSIDIIHPSYYQITPPLTWDNIPGNVVVTVYDFIMARFAHRFAKSEKVINNQTAAIHRANHIICISQATQNDLLERFPEYASKSSVVPLASSLPLPDSRATNPYPWPYFLFVGSRSFYKNFLLTLQTFALLRKKDKDLRLVVVGGGWSEEEKQQMQELDILDAVELLENPDDGVLGVLYKYCEALLYLSEFEGFGLPPLEAMKMGTPVIALNTSSLPEVVGAGGFLVEPSQASPGAISEIAFSLMNASQEEKQQRSTKAIEQANGFSWERTMQETIEVYQKFQ